MNEREGGILSPLEAEKQKLLDYLNDAAPGSLKFEAFSDGIYNRIQIDNWVDAVNELTSLPKNDSARPEKKSRLRIEEMKSASIEGDIGRKILNTPGYEEAYLQIGAHLDKLGDQIWKEVKEKYPHYDSLTGEEFNKIRYRVYKEIREELYKKGTNKPA